MGLTYWLVNHTKREYLGYSHIAASKMRELAGNCIAASVTTWYLLNHRGDDVRFLTEDDDWSDAKLYAEVTDRIVDELIGTEILEDGGRELVGGEDESDLYWRKLRNVWMSDPSGHR